MPRCAANNRAPRTVNQVVLTASAANIVQIDCASASTKMGISESYGICRGSIDIDVGVKNQNELSHCCFYFVDFFFFSG